MTVEIDTHSGFCGGVIRAIDKAEQFLATNPTLYSLGEMVHNEAELCRLGAKGLVSINSSGIANLNPNDTLLIRAHGEPPQTYQKVEATGAKLIDCTCPVVLKIQESIREAGKRLGAEGTIVIFGKIGHAEVLGLVGQVSGAAVVVVESAEQLCAKLDASEISGRVEVFSQTTMSPVEYETVCNMLRERVKEVRVHSTICRQVAQRHHELCEFAKSHDVVVFVSGKGSSNGNVLFCLCKSINPRTYRVGDPSELQPSWFNQAGNVGVCGATSTPKWLLEQIAQSIMLLHQ